MSASTELLGLRQLAKIAMQVTTLSHGARCHARAAPQENLPLQSEQQHLPRASRVRVASSALSVHRAARGLRPATQGRHWGRVAHLCQVAIDVVLLVDRLLVDIKNAGAESVAHLQTGAGLRTTIVILTKKRTTCVIRSVAIAKLASTRV